MWLSEEVSTSFRNVLCIYCGFCVFKMIEKVLLFASDIKCDFYYGLPLTDELHHQLTNERQKVVDLQQQLQGVGSNCLSVRELQEQIRDIQVQTVFQIDKEQHF